MLYVPFNTFSVTMGYFLVWTSTKQRINCCSSKLIRHCLWRGSNQGPLDLKLCSLPFTWVKVLRIYPEFRILTLTFHRQSASKCWITEDIIAPLISIQNILTQLIILTLNYPFCSHPASFKIWILKVQDFGNFELSPMHLATALLSIHVCTRDLKM